MYFFVVLIVFNMVLLGIKMLADYIINWGSEFDVSNSTYEYLILMIALFIILAILTKFGKQCFLWVKLLIGLFIAIS